MEFKTIKTKLNKIFKIKHVRSIAQIIIILILAPLFLFISYNIAYIGRVYPNIHIVGHNLGGLSIESASNLLDEKIQAPNRIYFTENNQQSELDLNSIDFNYDYTKSAQIAYNVGRSGNVIKDSYNKIIFLFSNTNIELVFNLNNDKLSEHISIISNQVLEEPIQPRITFINHEIKVENGKPGKNLDRQKLTKTITNNLSFANYETIILPINFIDTAITQSQSDHYHQRAKQLLNKSIILNFKNQQYTYTNAEIFTLLNPDDSYNTDQINSLVKNLAALIDKTPQNSILILVPSDQSLENNKVEKFIPSKEGVRVKTDFLSKQILEKISYLETSDVNSVQIDIPFETIQPDVKTEDVNNLGIKELVGRGTSRFAGSIASRIHNIKLASSKFDGVLVAPGETLSFNLALGDVSMYTGYKQAYIIKDGRTVLGDGGGVCQVSTTLFRAILDAGLPLVERRGHSYRVAYYEQGSPPGIDATVYSPTTDLKFTNNTDNHLLIQSYVNLNSYTLTFDIYGTNEGRVSNISKPVVTEQVEPPPDLYQDDPTLPVGTVKQIDWKAWGAKVSFKYTVEKDNETIYKKTFTTNYRPWQSVFLRGTGEAI
jgi:vancomycin resistance protein YoaR